MPQDPFAWNLPFGMGQTPSPKMSRLAQVYLLQMLFGNGMGTPPRSFGPLPFPPQQVNQGNETWGPLAQPYQPQQPPWVVQRPMRYQQFFAL